MTCSRIIHITLTMDPMDELIIRTQSLKLSKCHGRNSTDGEKCGRDGNYQMETKDGKEYYCFQHYPKHKYRQCIGKTRKKTRCEFICSNSEKRDSGEFICNKHYKK